MGNVATTTNSDSSVAESAAAKGPAATKETSARSSPRAAERGSDLVENNTATNDPENGMKDAGASASMAASSAPSIATSINSRPISPQKLTSRSGDDEMGLTSSLSFAASIMSGTTQKGFEVVKDEGRGKDKVMASWMAPVQNNEKNDGNSTQGTGNRSATGGDSERGGVKSAAPEDESRRIESGIDANENGQEAVGRDDVETAPKEASSHIKRRKIHLLGDAGIRRGVRERSVAAGSRSRSVVVRVRSRSISALIHSLPLPDASRSSKSSKLQLEYRDLVAKGANNTKTVARRIKGISRSRSLPRRSKMSVEEKGDAVEDRRLKSPIKFRPRKLVVKDGTRGGKGFVSPVRLGSPLRRGRSKTRGEMAGKVEENKKDKSEMTESTTLEDVEKTAVNPDGNLASKNIPDIDRQPSQSPIDDTSEANRESRSFEASSTKSTRLTSSGEKKSSKKEMLHAQNDDEFSFVEHDLFALPTQIVSKGARWFNWNATSKSYDSNQVIEEEYERLSSGGVRSCCDWNTVTTKDEGKGNATDATREYNGQVEEQEGSWPTLKGAHTNSLTVGIREDDAAREDGRSGGTTEDDSTDIGSSVRQGHWSSSLTTFSDPNLSNIVLLGAQEERDDIEAVRDEDMRSLRSNHIGKLRNSHQSMSASGSIGHHQSESVPRSRRPQKLTTRRGRGSPHKMSEIMVM